MNFQISWKEYKLNITFALQSTFLKQPSNAHLDDMLDAAEKYLLANTPATNDDFYDDNDDGNVDEPEPNFDEIPFPQDVEQIQYRAEDFIHEDTVTVDPETKVVVKNEVNEEEFVTAKDIISNQQQCSFCLQQFETDEALVEHIKDFHSADSEKLKQRVKCSLCDKSFGNAGILSKHVRQIHDKEKNFKCPHCPKFFFSKTHLQKHDTIVHKSLYQCKECNKGFASMEAADEHNIVEHQNAKPHKCKYCKEEFGYAKSLTDHVRVDHKLAQNYKCDICGRISKTRNSWHVHMSYVHDKLPRSFPCHLCDLVCRKSADIKVHIQRVHEGYRPFLCQTCGKGFTIKTKDFSNLLSVKFDITYDAGVLTNASISNLNPNFTGLDLGDFVLAA